jgi:hypothetical protein
MNTTNNNQVSVFIKGVCMYRKLFQTTLVMCFLFQFNSYAHIDKTSLSIKGSEKFKAGEKVQLTWKYAIFHNKIHYIFFSEGTGKPWQKIDSVMEKSGVKDLSYNWTVPQVASESARIRIFQSAVATPGEQTNDYTIVSNTFTILAATKTIQHNMVFDPKHSNSGINSSSSKSRYDISGRFVTESEATLTGRHKTMRVNVLH